MMLVGFVTMNTADLPTCANEGEGNWRYCEEPLRKVQSWQTIYCVRDDSWLI